MKYITNLLPITSIQPTLSASSPKAVIHELVGLIIKSNSLVNPNKLVESFELQERIHSTATQGIAFPQAQSANISEPILALAKSKDGVCFDGSQGGLTHIFIALVTPSEDPQSILTLLARLARLFKEKKLIQHILESSDAQRIFDLIKEAEKHLIESPKD